MPADVEESIIVSAAADDVYAAVSRVDRMARWSPECFAVLVTRRERGVSASEPRSPRPAWGRRERGVSASEPRSPRPAWHNSRRDGRPVRFVGFNRRKGYVWFTTCHVVVARPGREFAFDVFTFGHPVARWGYRLAPVDGGTEVTEYWQDRRNRAATRLGRIFTGKVTLDRPAANRAGMRTTLERLKRELEVNPAAG